MKRTWTIFALLFAGSISFANLQASNLNSQFNVDTYLFQQSSLTEQECHVLERAAPNLGITYSELVLLYETGNATISNIGGATFEVAAYVNDGNPVIAVIDSAL
ncbi:MAG: hypothetical protein AAGN35_21975 [Bacteroidota bacterium]